MRIMLLSDPQIRRAEDPTSPDRCHFQFVSELGRRGVASISGHFGTGKPPTALTGDPTEINGHWAQDQIYHIAHDSLDCSPEDRNRETPSNAQLADDIHQRTTSVLDQFFSLAETLNQDDPDIPDLRRRLGPVLEHLSRIGDSAADLAPSLIRCERECSEAHWTRQSEESSDELPF